MGLPKKLLLCFGLALLGTIVGTLVGAAGGFGVGWLLSLNYQKTGPNDVADAPAYVTLGLIFFGAIGGAVAGLCGGIVWGFSRGRRNDGHGFSEQPPLPDVRQSS